RQRVDASLDRAQDLSPNRQSAPRAEHLHGREQPRADRQRGLLPQRRRPPDADQEEPGAARPAILYAELKARPGGVGWVELLAKPMLATQKGDGFRCAQPILRWPRLTSRLCLLLFERDRSTARPSWGFSNEPCRAITCRFIGTMRRRRTG